MLVAEGMSKLCSHAESGGCPAQGGLDVLPTAWNLCLKDGRLNMF